MELKQWYDCFAAITKDAYSSDSECRSCSAFGHDKVACQLRLLMVCSHQKFFVNQYVITTASTTIKTNK